MFSFSIECVLSPVIASYNYGLATGARCCNCEFLFRVISAVVKCLKHMALPPIGHDLLVTSSHNYAVGAPCQGIWWACMSQQFALLNNQNKSVINSLADIFELTSVYYIVNTFQYNKANFLPEILQNLHRLRSTERPFHLHDPRGFPSLRHCENGSREIQGFLNSKLIKTEIKRNLYRNV